MYEEIKSIIAGQDMDYNEVLKYFGNKLELSAKDFAALQDRYKTMAFTVSGYSNLQILKGYHAKLIEAIANGTTLAQFVTDMDELLVSSGYDKLDPWTADNIFRTNLQTAYNVGAYQEMTKPAVLKTRPYWMYEAVDDDATRDSHRALDGRVWPADDPVWDTIYPPNGFRCRCSITSLSQRQVEQMGLRVEDTPPLVQPDQGFASNPGKIQFEPDLDGFPESLVKAYRRREESAP